VTRRVPGRGGRLYFQEPGVAEADLEANVDRTVRGFLYSVSGNVVTDVLPPWLTEDVRLYASEPARTGLHGGLSWFRNYDPQPGILGPFLGATITAGLHILPDAGHWIQQERPQQVNDVLVGFLVAL
jgi:hypothetical protein